MEKVKIFVEGIADAHFIKEFIHYHFKKEFTVGGYFKDEETCKKEFRQGDIIHLGGYSAKTFNLSKNFFIMNSDLNGINIVIFDADENQNGGGFGKRKNEIEIKKTELGIDFQLFLFPNNQNDGDFETLLENIINPKHQLIFDCFEDYKKCIAIPKKENGESLYELPDRKAKIFAFVDSLPKSRKQKEKMKTERLYQEKEFWDLDTPYLNPLKEFLASYLT